MGVRDWVSVVAQVVTAVVAVVGVVALLRDRGSVSWKIRNAASRSGSDNGPVVVENVGGGPALDVEVAWSTVMGDEPEHWVDPVTRARVEVGEVIEARPHTYANTRQRLRVRWRSRFGRHHETVRELPIE